MLIQRAVVGYNQLMEAMVERLYGVVDKLSGVLEQRLDDHDILVELKTNQNNMLSEMRALRADQASTERDHELRIRNVEKAMFYGLGGMAALILVLKFLVKG